jgi:hypothetical protein
MAGRIPIGPAQQPVEVSVSCGVAALVDMPQGLARALAAAELDWVKGIVADLEAKELTWDEA